LVRRARWQSCLLDWAKDRQSQADTPQPAGGTGGEHGARSGEGTGGAWHGATAGGRRSGRGAQPPGGEVRNPASPAAAGAVNYASNAGLLRSLVGLIRKRPPSTQLAAMRMGKSTAAARNTRGLFAPLLDACPLGTLKSILDHCPTEAVVRHTH